jgi:NAD(P)H-dependent flavin oxidoreductase YrpB (nitropropane dioxygenase family)
MEYYVGLDVSLKQTSICVMDQSGSVVREGVVDSDPEAISVYVRSKAPYAVRIGLETGPTSTWLWTELKRFGLPVICIDARHAKAVLKAAGVKVIHKCTSVRHALKAEQIGCAAVSIDGFECGGQPGEDDVPNMILLPRAADELKIPFVASGGMADARSLIAALSMGADGMNMGTRFIATKEAPVHENVKQAILAATELDTRLVMRPLRNTERVLTNAGVERLLEKEKKMGPAITFEDIAPEVAGVYPRIMQQGEMDAGAWSCGMVAGLIHDVPSVGD